MIFSIGPIPARKVLTLTFFNLLEDFYKLNIHSTLYSGLIKWQGLTFQLHQNRWPKLQHWISIFILSKSNFSCTSLTQVSTSQPLCNLFANNLQVWPVLRGNFKPDLLSFLIQELSIRTPMSGIEKKNIQDSTFNLLKQKTNDWFPILN